jgi:uncharacterized zinc-type alcohol dehydrogenase-like protein
MVGTYNGQEKDGSGHTFGGYSKQILAHEDFVLSISDKFPLQGIAPLLCAGITTYSPLKHWKVGKDDKVGVVGLGGLGHMGVKLCIFWSGSYNAQSFSIKRKGCKKLRRPQICFNLR